MPFPKNNELDDNLLVLIDECNGIIGSEQSYQPLANLFSLRPSERAQAMPRDGRKKWENDVQWSRRRLVDKGYVLKPEYIEGKGFFRTLWRITEHGQAEAHRLKNNFSTSWLARLRAIASKIQKDFEL